MEAAVDTLQAQFSKASADLDHVSRRLELSFSENLRSIGRDEINPISLLTRLDAVRNQMAGVAVERTAVDQALQESTAALASLAAQNCQLLHSLQATVGHEPMTVDGDISYVCGVAGVTLSPQQPSHGVASYGVVSPSESVTSMSRDESISSYGDFNSGSEVSSHQAPPSSDGAQSSGSTYFASDPIAAHSQRYSKSTPVSRRQDQPTTFLPITEDEFMTVSTLVRRRAKLDDINRVYEILFKYFKTDGHTGSLSTQKMTAMGLTITGSTGQAKLKSLAALKLLHMAKDNSVKLL